jgi:hypothetical protein
MICGKSCGEAGVGAWKSRENWYLADIEPVCSNDRKPICDKGLLKQLICDLVPVVEAARRGAVN